MDIQERNGLQEIIDKALEEMRTDNGGVLDLESLNLAEFSRRTGLSRSKARTIKAHGFKVLPHGRTGMRAKTTVLTGYTDRLDNLLKSGITNSSACLDRLRDDGYAGGITAVKDYIKSHIALAPAKRKVVAAQGSRGNRFQTAPGEAYQMDWGFVSVVDWLGCEYKIACFAMVCHHCGTCYIEFFPNARQESLFVGMVHAFMVMGVPDYVLTDNMKSVVIRRDIDGRPVWQADYATFMDCAGFKTRLCKPRHPFTKGKVERLIQFVKGNFLAGRAFENITQLNLEALTWCASQSASYRRALDLVPADTHRDKCFLACKTIALDGDVAMYLCPRRKVSFDGFVSYEGRRFGVPYWYSGRDCRVNREGELIHIYSDDLSRELVVHPVTWGRKDSFCHDQYFDAQPIELPSVPPQTVIRQIEPPKGKRLLAKFDFGGDLQW